MPITRCDADTRRRFLDGTMPNAFRPFNPETPGADRTVNITPAGERQNGVRSLILTLVVCAAVWAVVRAIFFTGLAGSDDLHYLRFAAMWDRAPANHWEARLLGNALTWLALVLFGRSEPAAVLPSLIASLTLLGCALYASHRYVGHRAAWWAGLLVALLPIDVYLSTTISPFTIMTALMSVGTLALLDAPNSKRARILAAACLSLGVIAHLSGVYYVAALLGTALCLDRRRYLGVAISTITALVIVATLDVAVFHFVFDDAFGRFRVCLADTGDRNPIMPTTPDGRVNPRFVTLPVLMLIFSKAFGISLLATLVAGAVMYRRLSHPLRLLWLSAVVLWLWMSYGSQIPWAYRPFWRMSRFLHPLTLAVAVLFGATLGARFMFRRPGIEFLRRRVFGPAVLGICLLNLLGSGSWGQNVKISRELLDYVTANPSKRFLTDYRTLNEMYLLGGVSHLPYVAAGPTNRSRLLDRDATIAQQPHPLDFDEILINPLNLRRTPAFANFVEINSGELRLETTPAYRPICELFRPLRRFAWAVRKPSARVVSFEAHDALDRGVTDTVAESRTTNSQDRTP